MPTLLSIPKDSPRALKYGIKFDPVTIDNITNNSKSVEVNLTAPTLHIKRSPTQSINESSKATYFEIILVVLAKGPSNPSIALPIKIVNVPAVLMSFKNK